MTTKITPEEIAELRRALGQALSGETIKAVGVLNPTEENFYVTVHRHLPALLEAAERVDNIRTEHLSKTLSYYEVTDVLIELLKTHSVLNQAEYDRNPSYNNTHPAYQSEKRAIEILEQHFGKSIVEILKMAEPTHERGEG